MLERNTIASVLEGLADSPVLLLTGARQVGKTTLVQELSRRRPACQYLTFDDMNVLNAAKTDPAAFVAGLPGPVILDEIQRVPELFVALKASVDRDRRPGRFVLTGSANVLALPRLSESLAGRMELHRLWGLSQGELEGVREGFIDALFAPRFAPPPPGPLRGAALPERILRGGYPEVVARQAPARRRRWFESYLATILQRDVKELAQIEDLIALPRLLAVLATRAAKLLNFADISRDCALPQTTLKRYLALLEMTYLVQPLPAWSANPSKRLAKAPKLLFTDTGLLAHLLGLGGREVRKEKSYGALLENFVALELLKHFGWSGTPARLRHFRTHSGLEVDLVLEDDSGRLAGIEVKASATLHNDDFKGLRALAETAPRKFLRGVVLYNGEQALPFGPNLWALPLHTLWTWNTKKHPARRTKRA